jgi:predicted dehydrogenase
MGGEVLAIGRDHEDLVVTVAGDTQAAAIDRHRPSHPDVRFTTDPMAVLDSGELDAVYIATPPAHHAELMTAALSRGLAVFCEKPLAIDLDDGRRMLDAASASDAPAFVDLALSDRHAVLAMERARQAGEVGQVVGIDVRLQFARWPRTFQAHARWLATRAQGGFLREVFPHFACLTDRLAGLLRPVEVSLDRAHDGAGVAARGLLRAGDVPVHLGQMFRWMRWPDEERS